MPSLTLKNLPDSFLKALREAAERDRRSLTQEVIYLVEEALQNRPQSQPRHDRDLESQVAAWRALAARWESDVDIETESQRLLDGRTGGREVEL